MRLGKRAWCVLQLLVEQWQAFLNSFVEFPESAIDAGVADSIDQIYTADPTQLTQIQLVIYYFYHYTNVSAPPPPPPPPPSGLVTQSQCLFPQNKGFRPESVCSLQWRL